jgi:multiple sugar transport system substrate-binding protein
MRPRRLATGWPTTGRPTTGRLLAVGLAIGAFLLAACSSSPGTSTPGGNAGAGNQPVTLTLSGWSLSTTPEFQTLADGFHKAHPNVTVQVKEYDATNYDTLMTADLASGAAPDIITMKNVLHVATYVQGGTLLDVSDVKLPAGISGASAYVIGGKSYAVPYRLDSWVLFYNRDLFKKAGVADPDGSWTWDDYVNAAGRLKAGLKAAGSPATAAYQHTWQSLVQGFANAQSPGANVLGGKYSYLAPYYQRALQLQNEGAQPTFNTATANNLSYQTEFGKQQAAMILMGTWEAASLLAQQSAGAADTFSWGMAPAPQYSAATAGTGNVPVTFGDPTGFAVNAKIDPAKLTAAKEFLGYAASEDGAKSLAAIGITPALINPSVVSTFFAVKGMPTDSLSKFAWSTHLTKQENPTSANTATVQDILNSLNTAVMSGSQPIAAAISTAQSSFTNQVGSS